MSDLVKRLQEAAEMVRTAKIVDPLLFDMRDMFLELATTLKAKDAEIERLQRDNLKHEAALAEDHLTIERLTAELAASKAVEDDGLFKSAASHALDILNEAFNKNISRYNSAFDAAITDKQEPPQHSERKPSGRD